MLPLTVPPLMETVPPAALMFPFNVPFFTFSVPDESKITVLSVAVISVLLLSMEMFGAADCSVASTALFVS
jgi:hypothetical protein